MWRVCEECEMKNHLFSLLKHIKTIKPIWIGLAMLGLAGGLTAYKIIYAQQAAPFGNPLFPPQMNEAQYAKTQFVIGDLGGVKVKIPRYFAELVEYDGDPGWNPRTTPVPKRTYDSKFYSFGFDARFPEMVGKSNAELWRDYNEYRDMKSGRIHNVDKTVDMWIDVGVTSGSHYYADGFLDRRFAEIIKTPQERGIDVNGEYAKLTDYEKLSQLEHGLTLYALKGVNPSTQTPYRNDDSARDIYIAKNTNGNVVTEIRCANHQHFHTRTCVQTFSMEPMMHAKIYVTYNRKRLKDWREIQTKVSELLWTFKANASPSRAQ
jgi:hypothetical protein